MLKTKDLKKLHLLRLILAVSLTVLQVYPTYAQVLPTGEQVVAGSADFNRSGNTLDITTGSDTTIIDYTDFSIGDPNTVNFNQPNSSSITLNRVVGVDPSVIAGQLNSNAHVWIVNPNGVFFGPNSQIDVHGLLASTLNISNEDFLAGNYSFFKDGGSAFIDNQGNINVANGGYVLLLAQAVRNSGSIEASTGTVALASGDAITVALDDLNDISVVIDEKVQDAVFDQDGNKVEHAIDNQGIIRADGGKITLTSKSLNDIFNHAVNNSGIIQANSLVNKSGMIELVANGDIVNTGRIAADGSSLLADGGNILITADRIMQAGYISANAYEGGTAGNINILSQLFTYVTAKSITEARAVGLRGVGGNIIFHALSSSGDTLVEDGALIDVSGGAAAGNAGFVEVSAKDGLGFYGSINGQAAEGYRRARILFDPLDIVINSSGTDNPTGDNTTSTPDEAFADNTGLTLTIDPDDLINNLTADEIFLQATRDITLSSDLDLSDPGDDTAVRFEANRDINLNANLTTGGSDITLTADADSDNDGAFTMSSGKSIASGGGEITISSGETTIIYGITAGAGDVNITSTNGDIELSGNISSTNDVTLNSAGEVKDNNGGSANVTADALDITATSHVDIDTTVTSVSVTTTGDLTLTETNGLDIDTINLTPGVSTDNDANILVQAGNITDHNGSGTTNITADDLNITATNGTIDLDTQVKTLTAVAGGTNSLTIRETNDLTVNTVVSLSDVTLTSTSGSISDGNGAINNITADNLNVMADGSVDLDTEITSLDATVTNNNLTIHEKDSVAVNAIDVGTGDVAFTFDDASAGITDGNGGALNVTADNLNIIAGTGGANLDTNINSLDVSLNNSQLNIGEADSVQINVVNTNGGNAEIAAVNGSITDGNAGTTNITANNLVLTARNNIDTDTSANTLSAQSTNNGDININEDNGIALNAISAGTGEVNLSLDAGAVTDNNGTSTNITAADVLITSVDGVGSSDAIETVVEHLEINNTNNDIQIANTGDLVLTDLGGSSDAIVNTNGNTTITASSPLEVENNVSSGGAITLTSTNDGGNNDHLTIDADVTSTGGGLITLNAGTNFVHDSGNITTSGNIDVNAENNAELGNLTAAQIDVTTTSGNITDDHDTSGNTDLSAAIVNLTSAGSIGESGATQGINDEFVDVDASALNTAGLTINAPNGNVYVEFTGGDAGTDKINNASTFSAAGEVLLASGAGNFQINSSLFNSVAINELYFGATGNIDVSNDIVFTNSGANLGFFAGGNIDLASGGDVNLTLANGTLQVEADTDNNNTGSISTSGGTANLTLTNVMYGAAQGINVTTSGSNINVSADNNTSGNISITNTGNWSVADLSGIDGDNGIQNAGGGDVTLVANSDLTVGAQVNTQGGNLTLTADDNVAVNAAVNTTNSGAGAGNVEATATNGQFTMGAGGSINTDDSAGSDGYVSITAGTSNGTLGNIDVGSEAIVLDIDEASAGDAMTQRAGTALLAEDLLLLGDSDYTLTSSTNDFTTMAANTTGDISVTDTNGLIVGSVTTTSTTNGITTGNNNLTLNTGNTLAINQSINAGSGDVDLNLSSGSVTDGNGASTNVTANLLDISSVGTVDLDTNVSSLAVTTTNSSVDINETDGVALNAISIGSGNMTLSTGGAVTDGNGSSTNVTASHLTLVSTGAVDIDTALDSIAVTTTNDNVTIHENNGLALHAITAGSGDVTITLDAGAITDGNGTSPNVTAADLLMTAIDGVGSTDAIETIVTNLEVNNTNNNIQVANTGDLTLKDLGGSANAIVNTNGNTTITASSPLDVDNPVSSGGAITLVSTNDGGNNDHLTVNSDITSTGGGLITLNAGTNFSQTTGTISTSGNIDIDAVGSIAQSGGNITADTLLADAGTSITLTQSTNDVSSLDAATTGTGAIQYTDANAVTLTDVTTNDGLISVIASGQVTATSVTAGDTGNNVSLTGSSLVIGSVTAADDQATLTAVTGSIIESGSDPAVDIVASTIDLNAVTGIGSEANPIETQATSIAADTTNGDVSIDNVAVAAAAVTSLTTGTGNLFFNQTGGGALNIASAATTSGNVSITLAGADLSAVSVGAGGSGDVTLVTTASGDVLITNVTAAGDDITVTAAGSILDADSNETNGLTAATANLTAGTDVGSSATDGDIDTNVDTLALSAGGDAFLQEEDGLTISSLTAGGAATLLAAGNTTLQSITTANDFTFRTTAGDVIFDGTTHSTSGAVNVQVDNGDITATAGTAANIIAGADSLLSTPNGTIGLGDSPLRVAINGGNLILDIGSAEGDTSAIITGSIENPSLVNPIPLPVSFPDPLRPPGNIFYNGERIWPSSDTFLLAQAAAGLTPQFVFPTSDQLAIAQVNVSDVVSSALTSPVFFYHPLTDVDTQAYDDGFFLEEDAYEFIDGYLEEDDEKKKK